VTDHLCNGSQVLCIRNGAITMSHDLTNSKAIVDHPARTCAARSALLSLILTIAEEVNAAAGPLQGSLGLETRRLVSSGFTNDPRSAIVDGPSTRVINGT
jgi:glyceraldehyde-3-phosphate dehydrogenase/erythrose-4-phosphate dehydrogenase